MYRKHLVATLLATSVLAACSEESDVAAPVTPQPNPALQRELEALKDPTSKMARAVSPGKPGAPVDLKYEYASKPEPGTPAEVTLALLPSAPADRLDISITGMDGLTLAGELQKSINKPQAGEVYEHRFSLLPNRTGMYYATVTATMENAGSQSARTFSIPLAVGTPASEQKTATPPQTDAAGKPIQPMKAQESGS